YYKVPTSTIQILIFCVVGTGVAAGAPVHWATILRLAVTWVLAPPAACALGYIATRLLDAVVPPEAGAVPDDPNQGLALIPSLLILMGLAASFVLGANDVSNAVGIWTAVHVGTATVAGLAGGLAMGIGALTWGRR